MGVEALTGGDSAATGAAGATGTAGATGAATGATGATGAAGATGTTGTEAQHWSSHAKLTDDHRVELKAHGWEKLPDPAEALASTLNSYGELRKLVKGGSVDELVRIPKDGDAEAFNAFANKLGRPEKPDGYTIPEAFKASPAALAMREHAHAIGLSDKQFGALLAAGQKSADAMTAKQAEDAKAAGAKADADLRAAWGQGYGKNMDAVGKAIERFEFTDDDLRALAAVRGPKAVIEMLAKAGAGLTEGKFHAGGSGGGGTSYAGLTPGEARAEIKRLGTDPDFQAKLKRNDAGALLQKRELDAAAVGMSLAEFEKGLASLGAKR